MSTLSNDRDGSIAQPAPEESRPALIEVTSSGAPELSRSLKRRHLSLIALGGVIGAGLFVGSSASIRAVGPAVVLSYLMAGATVYAVMAIIGELTRYFPGTQAFTDLVRASTGPGMGFVVGWLYWYQWIVVMAIEALAGAALLQAWMPLPIGVLSALLVLIMMGINLLPTRSFGEFEFWFSSVKVVAIVGFIAVAAAYCLDGTAARSQTWLNVTARPAFMPYGVGSVLTGVVTVFFSLTGAELTTIAAVESREGSRTNARLAAALVGRIILFYVGSVFLIVCVVPWSSIAPGVSPFTEVLKAIGFKSAERLMAAVILTAVLSCLNSAFYISSRVLFGLAAHADAPERLVKLNTQRVPVRSVLLGGVAASLCLLTAIAAPDTAFAFLVNAAGCVVIFNYLAICIAHLAQRQREHRDVAPSAARRVPRWVTYLTIGVMVGLLIMMGAQRELAAQLYVSSAALLVAVCAYLVVRRRRSQVHQNGRYL